MVYSEEVQDEIDALIAIYPDLITELPNDRFVVKVPQHEEVSVQLSISTKYPQEEPPHLIEVQIKSDDMSFSSVDIKYLQKLFIEVMDQVFVKGQVCIFDFLTELDGILYVEDTQEEDNGNSDTEEVARELERMSMNPLEGWFISDPVEDRGSTFIAFASPVLNEQDAMLKLDFLRTENRLKKANHIMTAWRIRGDDENSGVVYSDCDDDGETAAGSRMLHLITLMDGWNVVVVCARWFSGGHIGPDRFKHINSTTRDVLIRAGVVDKSKSGTSNTKSKKK